MTCFSTMAKIRLKTIGQTSAKKHQADEYRSHMTSFSKAIQGGGRGNAVGGGGGVSWELSGQFCCLCATCHTSTGEIGGGC